MSMLVMHKGINDSQKTNKLTYLKESLFFVISTTESRKSLTASWEFNSSEL